MANLEDIKTILLESRQAWAAAHKELLSAIKTNKTTNTKAADKSGRVGMPNMSGIMPQDMRQIFASFQNTLRQVFGGTSLAKFETTLKNTIGRAVSNQGSKLLAKQFTSTVLGNTALNSWANFNNSIPGNPYPIKGFPQRYGGRTVQGLGHADISYANMPWKGFAGYKPTKAQLAQMTKYGYDPVSQKFNQFKGETPTDFAKRIHQGIKGIKGIGGFNVVTPIDAQVLRNNKWVQAYGDDGKHPAFDKNRKYLSNRVPIIGNIIDMAKQAKDFAKTRLTQLVGPLFKTPAGPGWVGPLGRVGVAASVSARAIGTTFAAGRAAWTAARIGGATALRAGAAAGTAMGTAASTGLAGTAAALGLTNPVGWAIALILAVPALAGFTELLYKSQAGLKDFSAGMATVFAKSDLNKLKRNLISSERRSMVAGWLQTQSDAFKDKMLWIWDGLFNVIGTIAAGLLWIINTIGGIYDIIKAIWNWLKSWFVKEPKGIDMGPLGNTLKEFGLGHSNRLRSPGLFDWSGA